MSGVALATCASAILGLARPRSHNAKARLARLQDGTYDALPKDLRDYLIARIRGPRNIGTRHHRWACSFPWLGSVSSTNRCHDSSTWREVSGRQKRLTW